MRRQVVIRLALQVTLLLLALGIRGATVHVREELRSPLPLVRTLSFNRARSMLPAFSPSSVPDDVAIALPQRIERGQTLSEVLDGLGIGPAEAHRALALADGYIDPRRVRAGDRYDAYLDSSGHLEKISFDVAGRGRLLLSPGEPEWLADWRPFERSRHRRAIRGVLETTLEASLQASGAPTILASRIANTLQWDLDFHRDLRRGDSFEVLFEEELVEGELFHVGDMLALHYENRGHCFEAYEYGSGGHYDAEGHPLRKLFLRSPLKYSRVTSGFSQRRFHPVTKAYRPHYGVDYGAPVGTPVHATAAGVVQSAGWTQGGGRTVKLRHPKGYLTAYLHLSRFAVGLVPGRRVEQDHVVGYVGSSGLTSGPHLDYRVQHRGRWINPASLRNEPAPPIAEAERAVYLAHRDSLRDQLERTGVVEGSAVASVEGGPAVAAVGGS